MLARYNVHSEIKEDIRKLYSRGNREEFEDAWRATTTYLHIANWLSRELGMQVEKVIQGKGKNEGNTTTHPVGLIRVLDSPKRADEILEDANLKKYQFRIEEGTNFTEIENRLKTGDGPYKLSNGKWPHPNWSSYGSFVQALQETYFWDHRFEKLAPSNDQWVNSMILRGLDVETISHGRIFIQMGEKLPEKKKLLRSFSKFRIRPDEIRIL